MRVPLSGLPGRVTIYEVGPRDGLQNEKAVVPVDVKSEFVTRLARAGLRTIETTSFVHPRWVPQLADAEDLLDVLPRSPDLRYPVLVPNERGLERALSNGVTEIAIFGSATESFARRNLNRSVDESIAMFAPVVERAHSEGLWVRAYISMVCGDPWEGDVPIEQVVSVASRLMDLGCSQLSLGDTIGVGTPVRARDMLRAVAAEVPMAALAVHFHDTWGQALANVLACLEEGVAVVDSAVAGAGGCPYARGASGNLASEDLVYMLHGMGLHTGVDLDRLADTGRWLAGLLGRETGSKAGRALAAGG